MKEKYNHAFDIAFSVPMSEYKDWEDCLKHEKEAVINALQRRVRELFESNEYMEAISGFDTYEEGDLPEVTLSDREEPSVSVDVKEIEKQSGLTIGQDGTVETKEW